VEIETLEEDRETAKESLDIPRRPPEWFSSGGRNRELRTLSKMPRMRFCARGSSTSERGGTIPDAEADG
jgi:hypothetical protein